MNARVWSFFHEPTFTVTHVVAEPEGAHCVVIDPVLEFDYGSGRTGTKAADEVIGHIEAQGLTLDWILETHVHADHLTAAPHLKERLGGQIGIGAHIVDVQKVFQGIFNTVDTCAVDGSQFDHLFADGDVVSIGGVELRVMHTPGHTPACATYVVGDAAFAGDTLFMPDFGTARTDFPGGDAATLYRSIQRVLALPPETRLFMCHDYGGQGRDIAWETSVAEEKADNIHVADGISESAFVEMREARDKTLEVPNLILPALQVNMRAGGFPSPEENGVSYLKLPLNLL